MKKVSLKKLIFIMFMIVCMTLFSITSLATESVKETKESIKTESVKDEDEVEEEKSTKTTAEIEAEMKKGIVGIDESEENSTTSEEIEEDEGSNSFAVIMQNLQLKPWVKTVGIIVLIAIVAIVAIIAFASAASKRPAKPVKPSKTKTVRPQEKVEKEIPYKQENYEVYAKEDNEVFDKNFEKAEANAYKTLEENGFELPNRDDDDFEDMMNSPIVVPLSEDFNKEVEKPIEEKILTQEDKLNGFIKRIEEKKEVQQGLFDVMQPEKEIEEIPEIVEEIPEIVEEEEESLLGFDYSEEEKPVLNIFEEDDDEPLLGTFDDEPEYNPEEEINMLKEEFNIVDDEKDVPEEKEEVVKNEEPPVATRGFGASSISMNKKTNRFSFIEPIPENSTGEETKLKLEKNEGIGFRRKATTKKEEVSEEKKPKTTRTKKVKEEPVENTVEVEEASTKVSGEIDFLAEMEANMKKSKEDREKNKK